MIGVVLVLGVGVLGGMVWHFAWALRADRIRQRLLDEAIRQALLDDLNPPHTGGPTTPTGVSS